ncbi:unnamed protein product [Blepharisma stoltei]|uniref:Uncharacterized protein n=1 Tax=Blepharisma stoltei TaxID=1481888 RepID=A0AAU9JU47_9CILI|nr:unnamed protein product [Blepharisma stoltei]
MLKYDEIAGHGDEVLRYIFNFDSMTFKPLSINYEFDEINRLCDSIIDKINKRISTPNSNIILAGASSEHSSESATMKLLGVSALLILVFFIFVILDAYYLDDKVLTEIGILLISVCLLIHLVILLFDGKFSHTDKKRVVDEKLILKSIKTWCAEIISSQNKSLRGNGFCLVLSEDGNKIFVLRSCNEKRDTNLEESLDISG